MQLWSFYFLGKLFLFFMGSIRFSFALNLLFACFLAVPIPERLPASRLLKFLRLLISVPAAFLLFWHDSWLPPLSYAFHSLTGVNAMSPHYMLQFVLRSVSPSVCAGLAVLFVLCVLAARRFDLAPAVIFLMLVILPFGAGGSRQAPRDYFESFHRTEATRLVKFENPPQGTPDFDIVFLHI